MFTPLSRRGHQVLRQEQCGRPAPAVLHGGERFSDEPGQLRALNRRYIPYLWRAVERAEAYVHGPSFWVSLLLLSGAAVAAWPATTAIGALVNGALIVTGVLVGGILGEVGSRLVLPAPTRVTFKTTSGGPAAGPLAGLLCVQQGSLGVPVSAGRLPAEPVDGPISGSRDDPAGRARG